MNNNDLSRREWIKYAATQSLAASASLLLGSHATGEENDEQSVIDIGSRRELFIDDFLIDQLTGQAELQMNRPTPREVAIVHDAPWEGSGSGYHTVFQDGDLYRMYYRGLHLDVSQGKLNSGRHKPYYCYAESDDGIHWRKPELGNVE